MPSAVRLREDYSAKELRALARRSKDVNQSRRLLSLASVRDGMDRGSAAKIGGVPVAKIALLHSNSGASLSPRMRTRTSGRSVIWAKAAPPSSPITLSIEIRLTPSRRSAPSRFSVSSSIRPAAMTGHRLPVAIAAATSHPHPPPERAMERIAFNTSPKSTSIGRPAFEARGSKGSIRAHSSSVKSLGYRLVFFSAGRLGRRPKKNAMDPSRRQTLPTRMSWRYLPRTRPHENRH